MKSGRITRIVKILTTLQAGKKYSAKNLAALFATSRRTIFRDLKELAAIGIPYHYDPATGGYIIDPRFFLPPLDLNLQEALSLLVLVHKIGGQMQLPFRNSALLAALKIENNLPVRIRQYCNTALSAISVKFAAQAQADNLDKIFAALQKAIAAKRIVCLRYQSLAENADIELDLHPYHLFYNQRAWYVLGLSSIHKMTRTFKLSRILRLEVLDKCFVADKFSVEDYLGRAWSMIPEGRIYTVRLRFLLKVAQNVCEVGWHNTQQVTRNPDGSATVEFRVDGLNEITWWILGYGDQVQVLEPMSLQKRVRQVAENMLRLNSSP